MKTRHSFIEKFNPAVSAFLVFALLCYGSFFGNWFEGMGGGIFFLVGCAVFIGCMVGVAWRVIANSGTSTVPLGEVFGVVEGQEPESAHPADRPGSDTPVPDARAGDPLRPVTIYTARKGYINFWLIYYFLFLAGLLALTGYLAFMWLSGRFDSPHTYTVDGRVFQDAPTSMLVRLGACLAINLPVWGFCPVLFFEMRKFYRALFSRVEIYDDRLVHVSPQGTRSLRWEEIDHVTGDSQDMMFLPVNTYRQVTLWQDAKNGIELDSKLRDLPRLLQTVYEKYSAAMSSQTSLRSSASALPFPDDRP